MRKVPLFVVTLVLALGTVLGMTIQSVVSEDNTYLNLRRVEDAFGIIAKRYVEDVDSAQLSEDAIEGMLEGLDPHSVFIDAERMRNVREEFNASFEGIGISYEWTEGGGGRDTLTVLTPIVGGPSEEAGLLAGDRIVRVDQEDAVGWTSEDVQKHLKGPKGTKVSVVVKRPSYGKLLDFTITRDEIPLYTVDAKHMVDEQTGYIKLNRFARTTHQEVHEALAELKAQGMQRLVFDLRGNNGGYMSMAIRVSDEFLGDGQKIVYTKGRNAINDEEHFATDRGIFENAPVILLVDENSASASEIVAGALQDHDRALIVGRRTFGKGLVQQQFSLKDGSVLQLTTARYYTPTGRLIQTPYTRGDRESYYEFQRERFRSSANEDVLKFLDFGGETLDDDDAETEVYQVADFLDNVPDSLKYYTDSGRVVLGGGGILPHYLVSRSSTSLMSDIIRTGADAGFARKWLDANPEFRELWRDRQAAFFSDFEADDALLAAFWEYADEEFDIRIVADKTAIPKTPDPAAAGEKAEAAESALYHTEAEVEANVDAVKTRLKAYLARRIWGVSAWYPVIHRIDPVFQHAVTLWTDAEDLSLAYTQR